MRRGAGNADIVRGVAVDPICDPKNENPLRLLGFRHPCIFTPYENDILPAHSASVDVIVVEFHGVGLVPKTQF